jgi:hypothetical protein
LPAKVGLAGTNRAAFGGPNGGDGDHARLGKSKVAVWRWQERYLAKGIAGLQRDATRPGRKPPRRSGKSCTRRCTRNRRPVPTGASARWLPLAALATTSIKRIWKAHELEPHLLKTFKLSNDKRFVEKVQDIVGLYLYPPDQAPVLLVDEKCQIQALDRTQPGLPLKKGRCGTMTHDYKRHGTTTLFAALDLVTGKVIGQCMPRRPGRPALAGGSVCQAASWFRPGRRRDRLDHAAAVRLPAHLSCRLRTRHWHPAE